MDIDRNAHCIIKLEKLSTETILIAQHGIRDCFVKIAKLDPKEVEKWTMNHGNSDNVKNGPKKLLIHAGSVRSHCKWIPTTNVILNSMNARLG